MVTKYQLFIDLIAAKARAAELERISDCMRSLAETEFNNRRGGLKSLWTGTASQEFVETGAALATRIKTQADRLRTEAQTIRRIAQRTYDTEMKALEMANQRTYH